MHRRILVFYLCIAIAAGLILAAARIFMMVHYYEPETEMYVTGTTVPTVFRILTGIVCAALASSYFFFRKKRANVAYGSSSSMIVFSASLCCFLMLAYLLVTLYSLYGSNFSAFSALSDPIATSNQKMRALFLCLHLILLIPSAVYFFRVAAISRNTGNAFCILSMSSVIWVTVLLVATYLDISVSFNSPDKLLDQLTLIFLIFFLIYETRFHMGISKARFYFPAAFISIVLICIYTIPNIVLSSFWYLESNNGTVYDVLLLAFGFYIVSRCFSFLHTPDAPIAEIAES